MSFSQKVTELLKENGMSKASLAKDAGIPYTTLDSMLKRETDTARLTSIFRIAKALGTTVEDLVFDESGADRLSPEERRILELYALLDNRGKNTVLSLLEKEADNSRGEENLRALPVYEAPAAAGEALPFLTEEKTDVMCREGEIPPGADFGIRIAGDSMEPFLSDGDLVYVEECRSLSPGEIGIFILNGESLCKKLIARDGETYLASLNPRYEPIHVLETDDLKLVGRVIVE
jgi:SOS-response transcriptional repressor LexA